MKRGAANARYGGALLQAEAALARLNVWLRAYRVPIDEDTALQLLALVREAVTDHPEDPHAWLIGQLHVRFDIESPALPPVAPAPLRGSIGYGDYG